jgi:hypothetical protein
MLNLNVDLLRAKIYHQLKSRQAKGETLQPRFLEIAICESLGFTHVGDSAFYADGVSANEQLSVKTRMLMPAILKTKEGRDFHSHPDKMLGPHFTKKQDKWTSGIEIVQRRQQLDLKNDSTADPTEVGELTLSGFVKNIQASTVKYKTSATYELICVHGYDRFNSSYIISMFWDRYTPLDPTTISWVREGSSVTGYADVDGVRMKVCERINGNAKREATCFKEYKNLTKYKHTSNLKVPIPDTWDFNEKQILEEINLKEQSNATLLLNKRS